MEPSSHAIITSRLELGLSRVEMADEVLDFYTRNAVHLSPWEPPPLQGFWTAAYHRERLSKAEGEAAAGAALRWWLRLRDNPQTLVGTVGLSAIARGPFQSVFLGYALDGSLQSQGLMHEALDAVAKHAFSEALNLHRIQANVRPENQRSLRLLERLGFEREGFARDYLYINGAWRDHYLYALRNENFIGVPN